jgi:hypothetical protein
MAAMLEHPTLRDVHLLNFQDSEGEAVKAMCHALVMLPALELLSIDYASGDPRTGLSEEKRGLMLTSLAQCRLKAFSYRAACYPNQVLPAIGAANMAAALRRLELTRCVMPEDEALAGRALLGLPLFPALEELRLEFISYGSQAQVAAVAAHAQGRVTDTLLRALLAPLAAHRPASLARISLSLPAAAVHGDLQADSVGGILSWGCCRELMAVHPGLSFGFSLSNR